MLPKSTSKGSSLPQKASKTCNAELSLPCSGPGREDGEMGRKMGKIGVQARA